MRGLEAKNVGRNGVIAGASLVATGAAVTALIWPGGVAATDEQPTQEPVVSQQAAESDSVVVTRRDLIEEVEINGRVGHGRESTLPIEASGLVTETRASGDVVEPGESLLRVGDRPVTLAEGEQPLYRELRRVSSGERDDAGDKLGLQSGADVEQLQSFLLGAGFDDEGRLETDGTFGLTTQRAVKAWQRSVGHPATGKVDRSQLVFAAGELRIESMPLVGESFSEVTVTADVPTVTVSVTDKQRSFFGIGDEVTLTSTAGGTQGAVVSQKRTVGDDGSTRYEIEIEISDPVALAGSESVKVSATKTEASDVLVVPVRALIALAEGGWAVQVDGPSGSTLTGVELGSVVDGLAEISGIDEGATVVVPT